MGKVLDNTVVGIAVGDGDVSELRDPVQLTFAYQPLPHVSHALPSLCFLVRCRLTPCPHLQNVTPLCVFWEPNKGTRLGRARWGCGQAACRAPGCHPATNKHHGPPACDL